MRVKNWEKFQHFKDRKPLWIKLYRDVLDDKMWHDLDSESAKVLISLWLLASEDPAKMGGLPACDVIAFRLRITEKHLKSCVSNLSHWLVQDDINVISDGYQVDALETEKETETDVDITFSQFWNVYPRKVAKPDAIKAWKKVKPDEVPAILDAVGRQRAMPDWTKDGGKFVPYPASWLNARRWEDEVPAEQKRKVAW